MAFVGSVGAIITGSGTANIPLITDASGNGRAGALFSHALVQAKAADVTINFGGATQHFIPANHDLCIALRPDASIINATGDCSITLGRMQ